jgi:hypothetical protein
MRIPHSFCGRVFYKASLEFQVGLLYFLMKLHKYYGAIMEESDKIWFRIDEETNAVDSIVRASRFVTETDDPMRWKWVILGIDHALYMFCIIALTNTDYSRVLKPIKCSNPNCKKESALDGIRDADWKCPHCSTDLSKIARENLIGFDEAISRIQSESWMRQFVISQRRQFTKDEIEMLKRLHRYLRNQIQHFVPCLSSIEVKYIKQAINVGIDIIEFLSLHSGNVHLEDSQKVSVTKALRILREVTNI